MIAFNIILLVLVIGVVSDLVAFHVKQPEGRHSGGSNIRE